MLVVVVVGYEQQIPGFCSIVIVQFDPWAGLTMCFKFAGISSRSQARPAVICCRLESGFAGFNSNSRG